LHVGNLKVRHAIDHDVAGIVFLTAGLCVKTRPVKDDPNDGVGWNIRRRLEESPFMVYCLDGCVNVADACA